MYTHTYIHVCDIGILQNRPFGQIFTSDWHFGFVSVDGSGYSELYLLSRF